MLRKAVPLLPARNIRESIDFYESKLGFTGLNFGNYGILKYKSFEIHLVMSGEQASGNVPGCVIMVEDIEDLYTLFSSRGLLSLNAKLKDMPWGLREFSIKDNNNNLIRFAQRR